ncbi:MAG: PQQ-binding-like beta-propeller repeat protein [Pirellulales bacterium]
MAGGVKRTNNGVLVMALALWTVAVALTMPAGADDWPTYLHDNSRSGATTESIATPLVPLWTFVPTAPPDPAWTTPAKEAARVRFDDAFHVVVADGRVFFGSSGDNKVYALDALTGQVIWDVFTDGPVRVAPTVADGRVYFGSDDGHAYCVNAADGSLIWKVRAGDFDDRVIGHQRVISLWPVRSGVIVDDGVAYFAAGVFPNEGIYIRAVDAVTGEPIWRNDTTGEFGPEQQFDGISPQGPMLASRDTLYVASGRSMPAGFDRADGKFKFYLNPGGKVGGAYALLTADDQLVAGVNEQRVYDAKSGETAAGRYAWSPAHRLIVSGDISYSLGDHEVAALDRSRYDEFDKKRSGAKAELEKTRQGIRSLYVERYYLDDKVADYQKKYDDFTKKIDAAEQQLKDIQARLHDIEAGSYRWKRPNENRHSMVLAGDVVFTGGDDKVDALSASSGEWLWTGDVDGRAAGLAVADGKLYVSTDSGRIHCFTPGSPAHVGSRVAPDVVHNPYPEDELTEFYRRAADEIVSRSGVTKGFCLVVGCGEGRLALELARRTDLNIYAVDDDPAVVARARALLDRAGVYGKRVTVDEGSLVNLPYPTYFANLVVSDDLLVDGAVEASAEEVFRVLKPQGGVLLMGQPELADTSIASSTDVSTADETQTNSGRQRIDAAGVRRWLRTAVATEPEVSNDDGTWVRLVRGGLEGAGSWTHQYGNPANTSNSSDELVTTPLGVLWYGRPGPERMVERHARAAAPVSVDGRLFVQGENVVMAYDAYNGAPLWEREIPGAVRVRVDVDGSNMAVTAQGLFVATRDKALRLDPATGETIREYRCPPSSDGTTRRWGILYVVGDLLYGTLAQPLDHEYGAKWQNPSDDPVDNRNAYHTFNAAGGMWRTMMKWPNWGREDTWKGAVTDEMIASDAVFAARRRNGRAPLGLSRADLSHDHVLWRRRVVPGRQPRRRCPAPGRRRGPP